MESSSIRTRLDSSFLFTLSERLKFTDNTEVHRFVHLSQFAYLFQWKVSIASSCRPFSEDLSLLFNLKWLSIQFFSFSIPHSTFHITRPRSQRIIVGHSAWYALDDQDKQLVFPPAYHIWKDEMDTLDKLLPFLKLKMCTTHRNELEAASAFLTPTAKSEPQIIWVIWIKCFSSLLLNIIELLTEHQLSTEYYSVSLVLWFINQLNSVYLISSILRLICFPYGHCFLRELSSWSSFQSSSESKGYQNLLIKPDGDCTNSLILRVIFMWLVRKLSLTITRSFFWEEELRFLLPAAFECFPIDGKQRQKDIWSS